MPTVIQGFEVYTKPKDTTLESFPVFVQVVGGTQRVVTFPTEFNAIAISLLIENLFCQVAPLPKTDRQRDPGQKAGSL